MKATWIAALLGGAVATGLGAQTPPATPAPAAQADPNSKLVNVPGTPWNVYGPGQTNSYDDKGGPSGYPDTNVKVTQVGANAWDVGAISPLSKPVAAGDVVFVAVYLRAPELKDGETTTLPFIGVTGSSAPYENLATGSALVTNQWKQYYAVGRAPRDFAVGGAQAALHLASEKHVIDLGPVRVFDFGPNQDIARLPHN
jgi:hypothetical protein